MFKFSRVFEADKLCKKRWMFRSFWNMGGGGEGAILEGDLHLQAGGGIWNGLQSSKFLAFFRWHITGHI